MGSEAKADIHRNKGKGECCLERQTDKIEPLCPSKRGGFEVGNRRISGDFFRLRLVCLLARSHGNPRGIGRTCLQTKERRTTGPEYEFRLPPLESSPHKDAQLCLPPAGKTRDTDTRFQTEGRGSKN